MEKTGRQRIQKNRNVGKPVRCANCGKEGVYRVTYEDMYSKLEVTLCEECEKLKYGQLKLQSTFQWPGAA
jgi:excinuclease UvrABC ATPase subunit